MQIEKEFMIEIEQYDPKVVVLLIEEKMNVTEKPVLESVNQLIRTIKLYIRYKKEHFFLFNKLSEILSYKKKDNSH
jgi:hypothetical protein